MVEKQITTKAELLAEMERSLTALGTTLERLTEAQMTTAKDLRGWTVKDHLVHMTFWERSVVFLLQGKPRHKGLGIDETLYLQGTEDGINAAIRQQYQDLPLGEALTQFRSTHRQLLAVLQPLTERDLHEPYRHYLPDEPGEGDGPPALDVVYGNSAHHFAEHLLWIEALVEDAPK
jgi:hypothetical protein